MSEETQMIEKMIEKLLPCPFCGDGEYRFEATPLHRSPTMSGRESPIVSVEIRHWCKHVDGQPRRGGIVFVGRDRESATALWNRRCNGS